MKNIFVEGIPGTGKTTLLRQMRKELPEYRVYWEGNYSPVDLEWCTYMIGSEYAQALHEFPELKEEIEKYTYREGEYYIITYTQILAENRAFYEYMEQYELYNGRRSLEEFLWILKRRYRAFEGVGNVFECAFFQNTMKELMLYHELSEEQILKIYEELFHILRDKQFWLIYLYSDQIEENLERIKKERCDEWGQEMWYPLMLRYLNDTPYGKKHPFHDLEDMAMYFRKRMEMELMVLRNVIGEQAILVSAEESNQCWKQLI